MEGEELKKEVCSIRIENEILSKIDRIAAEEDRSRGAVIRRILRQFFRVAGTRFQSEEKDGNGNGNGGREQE